MVSRAPLSLLSVLTVFRSLYNTDMGLNNSQSMLIELGLYSAFPLSSRAVKSWIRHSSINFHSVICSTNVYCMPTRVWALF